MQPLHVLREKVWTHLHDKWNNKYTAKGTRRVRNREIWWLPGRNVTQVLLYNLLPTCCKLHCKTNQKNLQETKNGREEYVPHTNCAYELTCLLKNVLSSATFPTMTYIPLVILEMASRSSVSQDPQPTQAIGTGWGRPSCCHPGPNPSAAATTFFFPCIQWFSTLKCTVLTCITLSYKHGKYRLSM